MQENHRGPASRGDRLFSFQTFFLSGEVIIISLHNRRFISQARRTRHLSRSVGRARIARRGEEKNSFIRHLHISHDAPYLPPKILHKRCFQFPLGPLEYPGEMKNKGYAKFWGQIRCFMGDGQLAYILFSPGLVLRARFALWVNAAFTS